MTCKISDKIIELITRHLSLLDQMRLVSKKILSSAIKDDVDHVLSESDNRERLINITSSCQSKIQYLLANELTVRTPYLDRILTTWESETNSFIEEIQEIDLKTIEGLIDSKKETQKEIAITHRYNDQHQAYNLSTVK